jgi:hypothetical protein
MGVEKIPLRRASRCAANVFRVIRSRRMRCPEYVTHMGCTQGLLEEDLSKTDHLEDLDADERITRHWIFKK